MSQKSVRASETQVADLMLPPDANLQGNVFGGVVLKMIDKAAAVCAYRHAGRPCVTVAMERIEFKVPIHVGDFVTVEARINHVGRSSLEVGVEVYAEDPSLGARRHTNSCLVTMVALGPEGRPVEVPRLRPETPDEERRWRQAEERRRRRAEENSQKI